VPPKRARRLTERRKDARLVQAHLAAIVESSDDAIVSKTLGGVITSWNAAAERIFGFKAAEAIGQPIALIIPEERLGEETEILKRLGEGQKIDHFETVRRAKDGRLLSISLTLSPIRDASGAVIGASKIARDITERKRMESERQRWLEREQRARAHAERIVQNSQEFLAAISHELRNPLTAISGWAHLLQVGGLDADGMRKAIDTIVRNAAVQGRLISDILDVQKLTSGKVRLKIEDVDVLLVAQSAVDSIGPTADAKRVALEPLRCDVHPHIAGDPDRIQQVIWNLVSNAVKFTPPGGRVEILLGVVEEHVDIEVRDTGPGIRPEFLGYIFEPFRQDPSPTVSQSGLGLGLAIVRHLVELHGGTVGARNNDGGVGASFTVRLPLLSRDRVLAVSTDSADSHRGLQQVATPPLLRGLRVLLVDDEPEAREVVAAVLGTYGADVSGSGSVEEALSMLGRVRPHVLISDISMPNQDGYALLRALRALPASEGGTIPALALTAAVGVEDRLSVLRAGFKFHFVKPADPLALAHAVASLARNPEG
jgi:PAS domain S-box-containing protein